MTVWHIDAFDIETADAAEWETDGDGDRSIYRNDGCGWIFIPRGVDITEVKPPFKSGYYTCKDEINGAVSYFGSEEELTDYCSDYGYDSESFVKVTVYRD